MRKTPITAANVTEEIGRYMLPDVFSFILDLEKSRGNHLYDAKSGRLLLDCFSFIASNPLGYNHPGMNEPEFEKKLLRVAKLKPSNSDLYCVEMGEFVETFVRVAKPEGFKHLFFVDGGTLAVENALKVAFDWKVRLNFARGIKEERGRQVIHLREAFHGRSGYSLSLTNTADPRKTKYFPKFEWPRVTNPKIRFPLERHLDEVRRAEEQSVREIHAALAAHPDDIAAIILEPIQGEGGDNHFRPEYLRALRQIADEHECMLIFDEVQSGVGLTGKMWAFEHSGVRPDLFAFGKKMQVCGIAASPRVDSAKDNVFVEKSRINSTWGGSLTDMVRAERYLEILEEEHLVENARVVGDVLLSELEKLQEKFPEIISAARGKGLMCAVDLPDGETRTKVITKTLELGAIVLPCGHTSIRLRPSLTFSANDVGELVDILSRAIKAVC